MSSTQLVPSKGEPLATRGGAGTVTRQGFSGSELEISAETAGAALAAQSRAIVEARFIMAMRRPRDMDDVRTKLLRACERPGFAGSATEKVYGAAWYAKPVGEGVEGFSIRFVEEAFRAMGNIDVQVVTAYDDPDRRIITVTVTDLESNVAHQASVTFEKTVERKRLRDGEEAIRVRVGSGGKPVYIVPATDDEVFSKQQNLTSKLVRTLGLRHVPGDIQAECRTRILQIRDGDAAKDPDGFRRKVVDGFAAINVMASQLKLFLGHDIATCTPTELRILRDLWQEIKDGKTTWNELLTAALQERGEEIPASDTNGAEPRKGLDGLTDKLASKPQPTKPEPPPTQAPAPEPEEMSAEESARLDAETAAKEQPAEAPRPPKRGGSNQARLVE